MIKSKIITEKRYSIKKDYSIRSDNNEYFDGTSFDNGIIYQPDVYRLANFLAQRSGAEYIIDIGAGNGEKIRKYVQGCKVIAVDCDVNLSELEENVGGKGNQVIGYDLETGLPYIEEDILKKSVVISSDVIEHIVELDKYLESMSRYSTLAPYVLISTPDRDRARGFEDNGPPQNKSHVREWTAGELQSLLSLSGFKNVTTGYTINTNVHRDKSTILCIAGTHNISQETAVKINKERQVRVQAIMTAYNEEDVIEQTMMNLLNQAVDVHVIDNWSTDKTGEVVHKLMKHHPERVSYEKFPKQETRKYEWEILLDRVDEFAAASSYDWIIHHDTDEIRRSPHPSATLTQAITIADRLGYNAIDHTVIDFRPHQHGYMTGVPLDQHFRYFEYGTRPGHFQQVKGWKNQKKSVQLSKNGGHAVEINDLKVFPLKFMLMHYPLRSNAQANKKIFDERLPRITDDEKDKGWHGQYNTFEKGQNFIWDKRCLEKFHQIMFWQEHLVERISGIGIIEDCQVHEKWFQNGVVNGTVNKHEDDALNSTLPEVNTYINDVLTYVEQNRFTEACDHYNKFRKYYEKSKMIDQLDEMMSLVVNNNS